MTGHTNWLHQTKKKHYNPSVQNKLKLYFYLISFLLLILLTLKITIPNTGFKKSFVQTTAITKLLITNTCTTNNTPISNSNNNQKINTNPPIDNAAPNTPILNTTEPYDNMDYNTLSNTYNHNVYNPTTNICKASILINKTKYNNTNPYTMMDQYTTKTYSKIPTNYSMITNIYNVNTYNPMNDTYKTNPMINKTTYNDTNAYTINNMYTINSCTNITLDYSMITNMCNINTYNPINNTYKTNPMMDKISYNDTNRYTTPNIYTIKIYSNTTTDYSTMTNMYNTNTYNTMTN